MCVSLLGFGTDIEKCVVVLAVLTKKEMKKQRTINEQKQNIHKKPPIQNRKTLYQLVKTQDLSKQLGIVGRGKVIWTLSI